MTRASCPRYSTDTAVSFDWARWTAARPGLRISLAVLCPTESWNSRPSPRRAAGTCTQRQVRAARVQPRRWRSTGSGDTGFCSVGSCCCLRLPASCGIVGPPTFTTERRPRNPRAGVSAPRRRNRQRLWNFEDAFVDRGGWQTLLCVRASAISCRYASLTSHTSVRFVEPCSPAWSRRRSRFSGGNGLRWFRQILDMAFGSGRFEDRLMPCGFVSATLLLSLGGGGSASGNSSRWYKRVARLWRVAVFLGYTRRQTWTTACTTAASCTCITHSVSEWVSSVLTVLQHTLGHSVYTLETTANRRVNN